MQVAAHFIWSFKMPNTVASKDFSSSDLVLLVVSIILPPLAVALKRGIGGEFLLNVLLTVLGYVPGLVHAVWIVARS